MRKDETDGDCPETLGEYYDLVSVLFGKDSPASQFLLNKIETSSREEIVIASDSQMRMLLFSMASEV